MSTCNILCKSAVDGHCFYKFKKRVSIGSKQKCRKYKYLSDNTCKLISYNCYLNKIVGRVQLTRVKNKYKNITLTPNVHGINKMNCSKEN